MVLGKIEIDSRLFFLFCKRESNITKEIATAELEILYVVVVIVLCRLFVFNKKDCVVNRDKKSLTRTTTIERLE